MHKKKYLNTIMRNQGVDEVESSNVKLRIRNAIR
jgi:hypothetical protein